MQSKKVAAMMVALAVLAQSGCATVEEKRTIVQGERSTRVEQEPPRQVPGAAELDAARGRLHLLVTTRPECERRTVASTARTEKVERSLSNDGPGVAALFGAIGTALGTALLVSPGFTDQQTGEVKQVPTGVSLGLLAAGVAGLSYAGFEFYRARDSVEPLAPLTDAHSELVACPAVPVVNQVVALAADNRVLVSGRTDPRGGLTIERSTLAGAPYATDLRLKANQDVVPVSLTESAAWVTVDPAKKDSVSAYLAKYPNGAHAGEARGQLAKLEAAEHQQVASASLDAARSEIQAGNFSAATTDLDQASENGGNVEAEKAFLDAARKKAAREHVARALRLLRNHKLAEADAEWESATEILSSPDDALKARLAKAHRDRAWALLRRSRPDDAQEEWSKAQEYGALPDDKLDQAISRMQERAEEKSRAQEAARDRASKMKVCSAMRRAYAAGRGGAERVADYILQAQIDPYQQAANLRVAMRVAPNASTYLQDALATKLNVEIIRAAATVKGSIPSSVPMVRTLGALMEDKSQMKDLVRSMRDGIFFSLTSRAPGEFSSVTRTGFEDWLLESNQNFHRYVAVTAISIDVPPQALGAGLVSMFCSGR